MFTQRSRPLAVALAAVLLSPLAMTPTAASGPPTDATPAWPASTDDATGPSGDTVTLITGDVVTHSVTEDGAPTVTTEPAPRADGREVSFHSWPTDDGFVVVPDDAIGLVAAGVLDEDLFNLPTLLHEQAVNPDGDIDVLIEQPDTARPAQLRGTVEALSSDDTVHTLTSIDAAAIEVPTSETAQFWANLTGSRELGLSSAAGQQPAAAAASGTKVWLDRTMTATLDDSTGQIGAPTAWDLGFDGTGVTVAVLDTGIDAHHPDVADRIVGTADFTGKGAATDGHGHGTHVAGIVLGDGAASNGSFAGVAPGADLLVGKVLGDSGSGQMSQVIAGMEWAVAQGADVVNLSLSAGGGASDGSDPASRALDSLAESSDTLFVVAAGNVGAPLTVRAPGAATHALTVGAVDDHDVLAEFSSSGPRGGDAAVKPNLVAPGVEIGAARAAGTTGPDPIDQWYTRASGTSMAAPHTAGAAALLAQQHPDWDAEQVRDALIATATPTDEIWYSQGGGRLDVAAAVTSEVFVAGSLDFGRQSHDGDQVTRQVTFTNTGDDRIKLDVSVEAFRGWSGAAGPADAVRAVPPKVVLQPGASKTVRVQVDPTLGDPGAWGGLVTAEADDGSVQLSVPFSYYTGVSHRVDFSGRSADGTSENPYNLMGVLVVGLDEASSPEEPFQIDSEFIPLDPTATGGSLFLTEGDHQVIGMFSDARHARGEYVLHRLSVNAPQHVLLDATDAVPAAPELPEQVDLRGQQSTLLVDVAWQDDPFWFRSTSSTARVGGILVTPQSGGGFRYAAQTHAEPAAITQMRTSDGISYDPTYHVDSTRRTLADGGTFEVVSVGAGEPGDYAGLDVAGKVVVIAVPVGGGDSPTHDAFYNLYPRAGLAAGMGAAGVVAFLDDGDNPGGHVWNFGALPVLGLSAADGRQLATAASNGPLEVTLEGNATPDAVYRVRTDHDGQIGDTPVVLGHDDMARVDASHHADQPGTSTFDTWVSTTEDAWASLIPPSDRFTAPLERTEYVGPTNADVTWHREVAQGSLVLRSRWTPGPDDGGTTSDEAWFKAPLVPGAMTVPTTGSLPVNVLEPPPWMPGEARCSLCRDGDRLVPALHWLDSDPDHAGDLDPTVELVRDDVSIPMVDGDPPSFAVSDDPADSRLVATDTPPGRTARVTTETTFTSTPPSGQPDGFACSFGDTCAFQPAPQLRYDLPLDLRNRADAGVPFAFEVSGATAAGDPITDLSMQYSTDGGTMWMQAPVTALGDGRFQVAVDNPAGGVGDGHVALRAQASDAAGNTVDQTILGAYAVD